MPYEQAHTDDMSASVSKELYKNLAEVYDLFVQSSHDIAFYLTEAKETQGDILELMAKTGRVSVPLIQDGGKLTCVDQSPEMLSKLKEKLRRLHVTADIHQMDVTKLELNRQFNLIIIPFHSLSEILDLEEQKKVLAHIYRHLQAGGKFICTLQNPNIKLKTIDGIPRVIKTYPLDKKKKLVLWLQQNMDSSSRIVTVLEFIEIYKPEGNLESKQCFEMRYRLTTKEEFEDMASTMGFEIVNMYGDYSYQSFARDESPSMIWILRK